MKNIVTIAVSTFLLGAVTAPLSAEQPLTKGPPKTMGDEGKLPATGAVSDAVPEMRGPGAPDSPGAVLSDDGSKRMGDEGKLPATGAMSGAVPKMNAPSGSSE